MVSVIFNYRIWAHRRIHAHFEVRLINYAHYGITRLIVKCLVTQIYIYTI